MVYTTFKFTPAPKVNLFIVVFLLLYRNEIPKTIQAFMSGRLKVKGNVMLLQKMTQLLMANAKL